MHKNARAAAYAAEAAGEQAKYWPMHDLLYENQTQWSESDKPDQFFDTYAESLGLDMSAFHLAYQTEKYKDKIEQDIADGNKLGVFGTPTFYINGKKLGGFSEDSFSKAIDPLL